MGAPAAASRLRISHRSSRRRACAAGPPRASTFLISHSRWFLVDLNPANPLVPVSDYCDITALGVVTLTSDPLEIGLVSRPLIATSVPEVGSEGSNGATITVAGVTYVVNSDSPGGSAVPEPLSMLLVLTGIA